MKEKQKIIFLVDDDITNLKVGKSALSDSYKVFALNSCCGMLEMLENIQPDLILLDVNMPEMDGYEAIKRLKENEKTKAIPVIFLTALGDEKMELKGLSLGAIDYITKPFSPPLLLKRIEVHLLVEAQRNELLFLNNNLSHLVEEKTKTVVVLQNAILSTMVELVEYRDEITGGHVIRTQKYLEALINAMKDCGLYAPQMTAMDKELVLQASQLHDIGKITISDTILNKRGKLTHEEFEIMKTHATIGGKIIMRLKEKAVDSEFLEYAHIIAISHHEKWDGSGYPQGLCGENIPLLGRLMAVADVYDALVVKRPYKKNLSHCEAVDIILEGGGSHFDPALIDVFRKTHAKFEKIASKIN